MQLPTVEYDQRLECPCGSENIHIGGLTSVSIKDHVMLECTCEAGCTFQLRIEHHEGSTYISAVNHQQRLIQKETSTTAKQLPEL